MLYAGEPVRSGEDMRLESVGSVQCCRKPVATLAKVVFGGLDQVKGTCTVCGCSVLSSPRPQGMDSAVPVWLEKCTQHRSSDR